MADIKKENKRNLVNTAIWSTALLLVLAVGLLIFMSSAQRRTKNKDKTSDSSFVTESQSVVEPPVTDADADARDSDTADDSTEVGLVTEEENEAVGNTPSDLPTASYPDGDDLVYVMPINGAIIKDYTDDVAVYSLTMNDYRIHNGIDISAPVGTKVMACAQGVIERVWEDPFLGCSIEINHGGDIRSLYHGLSPELPKGIKAGVTVLAGDVIGGVGETMAIEQADSDHLHFAMTKGGVYVDPLEYISNFNGNIVADYEE